MPDLFQCQIRSWLASPGFSARAVELHIRAGRTGTRDRGAAITVEIRNLAVRSRDAAGVENVAGSLLLFREFFLAAGAAGPAVSLAPWVN